MAIHKKAETSTRQVAKPRTRQPEPVEDYAQPQYAAQPRQTVVTPNYGVQQPGNPLNVFMIALLVGAAFIIGTLYSRVKTLEGGTVATGNTVAAGNTGGTVANNAGTGGAIQPTAAPAAGNGLRATTVDPVTDDDHVRGSKDAPIVLIEYSDIECPFCQRFHPTMKQIKEEYGDKVAWVYRHFPLSSIHPRAQKAAEATECVAELGGEEKFWTYLDGLIAGSDLSDTGLATAAQQIGVNQAAFTTCLSSGKYAQKVSQQMASGERAGVTGTPGTVLVAGGQTQLVPGAYPYDQLKTIIDATQ